MERHFRNILSLRFGARIWVGNLEKTSQGILHDLYKKSWGEFQRVRTRVNQYTLFIRIVNENLQSMNYILFVYFADLRSPEASRGLAAEALTMSS